MSIKAMNFYGDYLQKDIKYVHNLVLKQVKKVYNDQPLGMTAKVK